MKKPRKVSGALQIIKSMSPIAATLPGHLHFCAYTLKDDPQPQVLFTFGFSNLKPAPSRVST